MHFRPIAFLAQLAGLCLALASACLSAEEPQDPVEVSVDAGLSVPGAEDAQAEPPGPLDELKLDDSAAAGEVTALEPIDPSLLDLPVTGALSILDYLGDTSGAPGPVLTLDEAVSLAMENNPHLTALALEVDARRARGRQAGIKPGAELDISLSEFMGMNQRRQFRHSVSEVTYSKVVESLDKRLARMRVARLGGDVAQWDYEAAVRDLQRAVAFAYVEALVAQENLRVKRQLLTLATGLRGGVALRYEAGTVSQLELSRLDIEVSNAVIAVQQAEGELRAAIVRLSALWGDLTPDFAAVAGNIADTPPPPAVDDLVGLLPENPFLARYAAENLERAAQLELALSESRPDYSVRGGVQGFGDSGEMALTVGITVPLKRHGLNAGNIREAEIRLEQLESQRAAVQIELQAQLVDAVERLRTSYELARSLHAAVLPAARDNVDRTIVGYRYGKFSYLSVLESERTLVEAVASYIDALAQYQLARVDVERLIGRPLATLPAAAEDTEAIDAALESAATEEAWTDEAWSNELASLSDPQSTTLENNDD